MKFYKGRFSFGVDQPEGMDAESFHESKRARERAVGHDPHRHVDTFRGQRNEIPEVVVRGLCLRESAIWFLLGGVNEVGKFNCILNEKNRNVISDDVPVALLGIE